MYTSSGIFKRISCLIALSSAERSIILRCIRSSHFSYVSVPLPHGDFLVTTFKRFTGRGVGPLTLTPVFFPMPMISEQTPSNLGRLVLVSLMRADCVKVKTSLRFVFFCNFFYNACCNSSTHVSECEPSKFWKVLEGLNAGWSYRPYFHNC